MKQLKKALAFATAVSGAFIFSAETFAKEIIVTAARPNLVVVADAEKREVIRTHEIPNTHLGNSPGALVVSDDGKVAYVIHNRWETVSGIHLKSGKEVFRAELSGIDLRGKAPFAIDLSPDNKELAVYVTETEMLKGEYRVRDPHIAIFDVTDGIDAKAVRKLPVPRRTSLLAYTPSGDGIYASSWDFNKIDPQTGEILKTIPWRNWERKNRGAPDTLAIWPQFEQTDIFATPFFFERTDQDPNSAARWGAGIWTLDLNTEKVKYTEFEDMSVVLFSSVVNPVRKNEVYTVYTQLTKTDVNTGELMKRIDLPHTYYDVNVSADGKELYVGGTTDDIAVFDSVTLDQIGEIRIPGGGDQVLSSLRVVDAKWL